jgi:hypothetical protein
MPRKPDVTRDFVTVADRLIAAGFPPEPFDEPVETETTTPGPSALVHLGSGRCTYNGTRLAGDNRTHRYLDAVRMGRSCACMVDARRCDDREFAPAAVSHREVVERYMRVANLLLETRCGLDRIDEDPRTPRWSTWVQIDDMFARATRIADRGFAGLLDDIVAELDQRIDGHEPTVSAWRDAPWDAQMQWWWANAVTDWDDVMESVWSWELRRESSAAEISNVFTDAFQRRCRARLLEQLSDLGIDTDDPGRDRWRTYLTAPGAVVSNWLDVARAQFEVGTPSPHRWLPLIVAPPGFELLVEQYTPSGKRTLVELGPAVTDAQADLFGELWDWDPKVDPEGDQAHDAFVSVVAATAR